MGAIDSVDGLVSALPDEHREAAQAFLAKYADESRSSVKGEANATAAELRKARAELMELRGLKSTYEADLANAREQAQAAKGAGEKLTEYEKQIATLKAERESLAGFRDRYARRALLDAVAEHGRIVDRDYVPALVERLGLVPKFNDDGNVILPDDAKAKLDAFMSDPANRSKYQGGKATFQRPGAAAAVAGPSIVETARKRIEAAAPEHRETLRKAARAQGIHV